MVLDAAPSEIIGVHLWLAPHRAEQSWAQRSSRKIILVIVLSDVPLPISVPQRLSPYQVSSSIIDITFVPNPH